MLCDQLYHGDCLDVLKEFPDDSIDLCCTSPPYADARKATYGGVAPDAYVEWFTPIASEIKRTLAPRGSFVLNIKEKCQDGQRHTYVLELTLALKQQGWLWVEDYCWHKSCCAPGKWPNRFRDAWEHCLHFAKRPDFLMFQDAVMVEAKECTKERAKKPCGRDAVRIRNITGSGIGTRKANWVGRDMAYPSNVLHGPTEAHSRIHSAAFPLWLPSWFIKLFTKEGQIVLDPFAGSATTCVAARDLSRHYIGIEKLPEYVEIAEARLGQQERPTPADSKMVARRAFIQARRKGLYDLAGEAKRDLTPEQCKLLADEIQRRESRAKHPAP
jgi:site-specific DNA-methyltransferase (adenine-specific)/site-specific DNA-methyltransferase (cytosine-N4-specific)